MYSAKIIFQSSQKGEDQAAMIISKWVMDIIIFTTYIFNTVSY